MVYTIVGVFNVSNLIFKPTLYQIRFQSMFLSAKSRIMIIYLDKLRISTIIKQLKRGTKLYPFVCLSVDQVHITPLGFRNSVERTLFSNANGSYSLKTRRPQFSDMEIDY